MKKFIAMICALVFLTGVLPTAFANVVNYGAELNPNEEIYTQTFSDIPTDHWAFQYIEELVERKAINGYPDGKFYPDKIVTREEFAKIMIVAAGLTAAPAQVSSYADVPLTYWASPFIETAKPYMTAYQSGGQAYFKPTDGALREDMAVAVVMLKGYDTRLADLSMIQTMFTDIDAISAGAQPYVALAVENGIISGYSDGTFRGQATITRCEAAAILWRAFQYGSDSKLMPGETAAPVPSSSVQPSQEEPAASLEPTEPPATEGKPYAVVTLADVGISSPALLMTMDSNDSLIYYDADEEAILSLNPLDGKIIILLDTGKAAYTDSEQGISYEGISVNQVFWDNIDSKLLIDGTFQTTQDSEDGWSNSVKADPYTAIFTLRDGVLEKAYDRPERSYTKAHYDSYYDYHKILCALGGGKYICHSIGPSEDFYYLYDMKKGSIITDYGVNTYRDKESFIQGGKNIYQVLINDSYLGDCTLAKFDYGTGKWNDVGSFKSFATTYQNELLYTWSDYKIQAVRLNDVAYQVKVDIGQDVEVLDMQMIPTKPESLYVTSGEEYLFYDSAACAIRAIRANQ